MNLILPIILLVSHHQIVLHNIQQRPQVVLASSPWALTLILQNWLLQVLQYLCYPLLVLNQLENLLLHPFLQLDRIYILVHDNFHRILKKKKIMELLITFKTSKTLFSSQKQPTGVLYNFKAFINNQWLQNMQFEWVIFTIYAWHHSFSAFAKFTKKTFLNPDMKTYVGVSRGKKY